MFLSVSYNNSRRIPFYLRMKRILFFLTILTACVLAACSDDDSFSTSQADTLTFSVDTVKMDTVFAHVASSTYSFWVYNHAGGGVRLNTVRLANGNQTGFRVNVDGTYLDNTTGAVATGLEVRKGDSLRVFVELTAPETRQLEPQLVSDELVFALESGVEQRVRLEAWVWDAEKLTNLVVSHDTLIDTRVPIIIYGDGIRVDSGAVLTLRNTTLYFHDGAGLQVDGRLVAENCVMRGDRLDHMFDYLPYDRISGQWRGIIFGRTSTGNEMTDSEVRNAMCGVLLEDSALLAPPQKRLTMTRCVVHNAKGHGIVSYNSFIGLYYCQLTNTQGDCLAVYGGLCDIDHCTLAQFYPFSAERGAALRFANSYGERFFDHLELLCTNSIITGYADDVVFGETADTDSTTTFVYAYEFENCLMRTPKVEGDSVSFRNIMWETPDDSIQGTQHFVVIDEKNLYYDFHLDSLSTAQGKGCY